MKTNALSLLLVIIITFFIFEVIYQKIYIKDAEMQKRILILENSTEITMQIEEFLSGPLLQDDERILKEIKKVLEPPQNLPYNLKNGNKDPSQGQSKVVQEILQYKENGFFVECGALDGETRSNSLIFEKKYNWKGLLIEADPANYKKLLKKNRQAWTINVCLAIFPYPHKVKFRQAFNIGKITKTGIEIQCFPFYSILSAMEVKTVDYFSLDVEGFELQVLKTIPFDLILIKVLSVEYVHDMEGQDEIVKFMKRQGFVNVSRVVNRFGFANDIIFIHKSVKMPPNVTKLIST